MEVNMPNNIDDINYDTSVSHGITETYFNNQHLSRLVRHQKESYNQFVSEQIKETIQMFNPVLIHSEHVAEILFHLENKRGGLKGIAILMSTF